MRCLRSPPPHLSRTTRSQGFTLIELIMVVVIVGILAAVLIPKYRDLSSSAAQSSVRSAAITVTSGSMNNRAAFAAKSPTAIVVTDEDVCTPASFERFLQAPFPSDYVIGKAITPYGLSCSVPGQEFARCGLTHPKAGSRLNVDIYCAGNN